eukprot:UN26366
MIIVWHGHYEKMVIVIQMEQVNFLCSLKSDIAYPDLKYDTCQISGTTASQEDVTVLRPALNGKPFFASGWLDQSFWPDGLYAAPNTDALIYDLQAAKMFGFNMVRLHQKVNPERWYHAADQMGLLIWQDMPQKYKSATNETIPSYLSDAKAMINGKKNHPSVIQWQTFNEADCWHVFNQP